MSSSVVCNTTYIIRNTIVNAIAIICTIICIIALYRIIRIQLYSKLPMQSFLFYVCTIFYISSILILPFAFVSDVLLCLPAYAISAHNFNDIERIFFGLELLCFLISWVTFNIVLFARLYFTFNGSIYSISKQCVILSITILSFLAFLFFPGFTLYVIYDISMVTVVLFTSGFLCLLVFSQIIVFMFVYKLFVMNIRLVDNLGLNEVPSALKEIHSNSNRTSTHAHLQISNCTSNTLSRKQSDQLQSISSSANGFDDKVLEEITIKRRSTIHEKCSPHLELMTKYTLLIVWSGISSVIAMMACIVWILSGLSDETTLGIILMNIIGVSLAFHLLLNVICVTFAFKIYEKQYGFLCSCCDSKLQECCFNLVDKRYESKEEMYFSRSIEIEETNE